MTNPRRALASWLLPVGLLASSPTIAAELVASVEIPTLQVAEYHRPYVAIWIENDRSRHQADIALWFDHSAADNEGTKWLKDLRQWWRRSGRTLEFPADGITGATRPVGLHQVRIDDTHPALANLPAGDFQLVIEAAREVGGRELVKLPFKWPVTGQVRESVKGSSELGLIELSMKP